MRGKIPRLIEAVVLEKESTGNPVTLGARRDVLSC